MRRFLRRFRQALWGVYNDGCLGYAKGAAYSALLSFFPLLTTVTTALVLANAESVSRHLADFLFEVVPPGADLALERYFMRQGAKPVTLPVIASLLSLWAASGVMISLMEGFQAAYKTRDTRGVVHKRILAVILIFVAVGPVVAASSVMLFGARTEAHIVSALGFSGEGDVVSLGVRMLARVIRYSVALGATVLVTAVLYYLAPTPRRRWRCVWPGAWLATTLWLLVTLGFAWYERNLVNYNLLYGSIGTAIALLVWMYLLAVIALLGCEYNAAVERR